MLPGNPQLPAETETDELRLERLKLGDDLALNRMMARWQRPLLSFALRYVHSAADADDLVIETFVRLYQNRRKLRPGSNLSAWLFTTLSRLCLNHLRWQKRHPSVAGAHDDDRGGESELPDPSTVHPATPMERSEDLSLLRQAIDRLPHEQKTILLLHHYEGMPVKEVATVIGCSEKAVENRLYRLRRNLRIELASSLETVETPDAVTL